MEAAGTIYVNWTDLTLASLVGAVRAVVHLVAVGYTLAYIFTVG